MKRLNKQERMKQAIKEHNEFLRRIGFIGGSSRGRTNGSDPLNGGSTPSPPANLPSLSNNVPVGGGFKKSVDDYKWRRGAIESPETVKEIELKKKMIAPIYNKGAYQYIGRNADIETLGKKI